jgi:putative flippase GtrA
MTLLVLCNGVALVLANLNSYIWNTLWTFREGPSTTCGR